MKINSDVLPFAAQLMGVVFRALGWDVDLHFDKEDDGLVTNKEVRQRLTKLAEKITETNKVADDGRLRLEYTMEGRSLKAYIYLGNLKAG